MRESHEETRRKVIASEAKQSAVFLFASTKTRESKQAAAPPYCDSKFPAIRITGARSDGSVICHCERSEAICSFSFCFYPRQENQGRLPRPLVVIQKLLPSASCSLFPVILNEVTHSVLRKDLAVSFQRLFFPKLRFFAKEAQNDSVFVEQIPSPPLIPPLQQSWTQAVKRGSWLHCPLSRFQLSTRQHTFY